MSVVSYLWSAITELCVHFRRVSHLDVKLSYLPKIQRLELLPWESSVYPLVELSISRFVIVSDGQRWSVVVSERESEWCVSGELVVVSLDVSGEVG